MQILGKLFAVKISQRNATADHAGMRDDEIQVLIRFGQHPNIITLKGLGYFLLKISRTFSLPLIHCCHFSITVQLYKRVHIAEGPFL